MENSVSLNLVKQKCGHSKQMSEDDRNACWRNDRKQTRKITNWFGNLVKFDLESLSVVLV